MQRAEEAKNMSKPLTKAQIQLKKGPQAQKQKLKATAALPLPKSLWLR